MSKSNKGIFRGGIHRDSVELKKKNTLKRKGSKAGDSDDDPAAGAATDADYLGADEPAPPPAQAAPEPLTYRMAPVNARLAADRAAFETAYSSIKHRTAGGYTLDRYNQLRLLGAGSFGRVILVEDRHDASGELRALKIQSKANIFKEGHVEHLRAEHDLLHALNCKFLVHMTDSFQDAVHVYFVMDVCTGGELFEHLSNQPNYRFPSATATFIVAQVTLAFEYLHNLDIMYRDLKPENILLDWRGNVKLTDLGFAKRVYDITFTMCGTPEYLAPETILDKGYSHAVDWWAVGILTFELLNGSTPFVAKTEKDLFVNIITNKYKVPRHFKGPEIDFIDKLLQTDVTRRLGRTFGGTEAVKRHIFFKDINWDSLLNGTAVPPFQPKLTGPRDLSGLSVQEAPFEPAKWAAGRSAEAFGDAFVGF